MRASSARGFDYIVVSAGSAGCVVGNVFLLPHARYNWQHSVTGGAGVNDRSLICPRGKPFGGRSSATGSVYIRGHRHSEDFNGAQQDGFGIYDLNQRREVRPSSSRAFLHPVVQPGATDTAVEGTGS